MNLPEDVPMMDWTDRALPLVFRRAPTKANRPYTCLMPTTLTPIESEFATAEEAEAYERWLRAKVQASLDDPRPNIPHDQVMARMRALLAKKRKTATSNSKS
jgi:hypothetical protein